MCCPIDIGGASGGDPLYLYTDCSVASVQTIQDIGGCCSGGTNNVVLVKMFSGANATGTFIGAVAYLHVDNPIANGIYNAGLKCRGFSYWAIQVGNFVSDPGNCSCYKGVHSHMQRDGGSSGSFSCGQSLTGGGGGSVIFSWTF